MPNKLPKFEYGNENAPTYRVIEPGWVVGVGPSEPLKEGFTPSHLLAQAMFKEDSNAWNRVEDGLPKPDVRVLVLWDLGGISIDYVEHPRNQIKHGNHDYTYVWHSECEDIHDGGDGGDGIATHWMPLPKPPLK